MTSQAVKTLLRAEPLTLKPDWLWTWNGVCFGYRLGDSLFTHDGVEVGRFSGPEVYGVDGRYLGEVGKADDGGRLVTNLYKKMRTVSRFAPTFDRSYRRPTNHAPQPLYSGHEEFPSPETARAMVFPK
jgi:hypothetical protein